MSRHFHEKLREERGIGLSYTWVKLALQGAGLVKKGRKRGVHRKRRVRRPLPGMRLHLDGSQHHWFQDQRWHDLIVILDDATREIYCAPLVEEESTRTVMAALREVVERKGAFCALYRDRASHFFLTPQVGEAVDRQRLTQGGRAWSDLRIEMIPAYSPPARGRGERNFPTWQGRLPQELRLHGIQTLKAANRFLREPYRAEFNHKFTLKAAPSGTAFVRVKLTDLDRVFSIQQERRVNRDNTVSWANHGLPIEKTSWRGSRAGCRVTGCEHLDGTVSIVYGPHRVGHDTADGAPLLGARQQGQSRTLSPPISAPGSAFRSHPCVALSSAQAKASLPREKTRRQVDRQNLDNSIWGLRPQTPGI